MRETRFVSDYSDRPQHPPQPDSAAMGQPPPDEGHPSNDWEPMLAEKTERSLWTSRLEHFGHCGISSSMLTPVNISKECPHSIHRYSKSGIFQFPFNQTFILFWF
jgi:hypothetical protein